MTYAPQLQPPPAPPARPPSKRPWWRATWAVLAAGIVVGLIVGAAAAASAKQKPETVTKTRTIFQAGPTQTELVPGPTVTNTEKVIVTVAPRKPKPKPKPKLPVTTDVTYRVSGNGSRSMITYTIGGSIEQATGASVPWSMKQPLAGSGALLQVSAQDTDGTAITCEIDDIDGSVLDKHTSTGAYAIVTCQSADAGQGG